MNEPWILGDMSEQALEYCVRVGTEVGKQRGYGLAAPSILMGKLWGSAHYSVALVPPCTVCLAPVCVVNLAPPDKGLDRGAVDPPRSHGKLVLPELLC